MKRPTLLLLTFAFCTLALAYSQGTKPHSRDREIKDADTRAWWHLTRSLSGDDMQGRDTGYPGYDRAARLVAAHFHHAGLRPAGDKHTYFQEIHLHEVQVLQDDTSFTIVGADGKKQPLDFLHEISIRASTGLPSALDAPLIFAGYCAKDTLPNVKNKIVVCFGTRRSNLVNAAQRTQALTGAGAAGVIVVDDPYFTLEPARWPAAYARTVSIDNPGALNPTRGLPTMTLSAAAFPKLIAGSDKDADGILAIGGRGEPLPTFEIPSRLQATLNTRGRYYSSRNVLAVLPGSDPKLRDQYVVIAAHLDGYGVGEPVNGDSLYNGTLDDAAYVALLMHYADRLHDAAKPLRRSILFCAFTGEEKGLLGSRWFTQHPTIPKEKLVADINLDQLRPLFPLNILTTLAVDKSTLGQMVKEVAGPMHIEIRADMEPERSLLTRADHWPFMEIGVPAVGFIFGYDKGTDAEKKYREWYNVRYHRPQDDVMQPVDFEAAAKFNEFFYRLVAKVADADEKPQWIK